MECKQCGGKNIVEEEARAEMVCEDCGVVCELNDIQADTEFQEMSNGRIVAIGTLVTTGAGALKQVTLNKAQEKIDKLCSQLFLTKKLASYAMEIFKSALKMGLTRGRGALVMAGACVYLAARLNKQSLMLLDISDKINVNVYVLGKTYNIIKETFGQKVQDIDPCLFIDRFARELEFGEQREAVSMTALKLLQRMKKDWISTGRRPCGITAAALLIAARIHHFDRNYEDVARIAGISQQTAKKRLQEWCETATANLTLNEFKTIDYEEEFDPPSFLNQKNNGNYLDINTEISPDQFDKIQEEIKLLSQKIDEADRQNNDNISNTKNLEGDCFSALVASVEEGAVDIADLLGDLNETLAEEGDGSDLEEEIAGRRELLTHCLQPKLMREMFRSASNYETDFVKNRKTESEDSGEKVVNAQLPITLPTLLTDDYDTHMSGQQLMIEHEFEMGDISDGELESMYISSKEESVKKLRWWYKVNQNFYRNKKLAEAKKEEQRKKNEGSGRKPRVRRQKRGCALLEQAGQLLRDIKPGSRTGDNVSDRGSVAHSFREEEPPMKRSRLDSTFSYTNHSDIACADNQPDSDNLKYETKRTYSYGSGEEDANDMHEYTGEPQYEFDEV